MAEHEQALREVRQLDYVWIPMRDGAQFAARVWLPADAEAEPVPAILEAVAYRLSDGMGTRHDEMVSGKLLVGPDACGQCHTTEQSPDFKYDKALEKIVHWE